MCLNRRIPMEEESISEEKGRRDGEMERGRKEGKRKGWREEGMKPKLVTERAAGLTLLFVCGQPQVTSLCGPQFSPSKKKAWISSLPRPLRALTFCDFLISFRLQGPADPMLMGMNKTWASESSQYCRYLLGFVLH